MKLIHVTWIDHGRIGQDGVLTLVIRMNKNLHDVALDIDWLLHKYINQGKEIEHGSCLKKCFEPQ